MPLLRFTKEFYDAVEGKLPEKVHNEKGKVTGIQVLENKFLERWFGTAHPITPGIWFGPFVLYGIYQAISTQAQLALSIAAFAGGTLFLSLFEYVLHRFLFHLEPTTPKERERHFIMHGYHHVFPNDRHRLVLPPLMSWPIGALLAALCYAVAGNAYWAQAFAGICIGYIAYDWVHYYTHHFKPRSGIGRWLRDYHLLHHHDEKHPGRYGVSSPLWDIVFRTYYPVKSKKPKGTEGKASIAESSPAKDACDP
jgi:sterol desaturase/sphingolipid hydroxylase (fatty acid hydroxylase superfamily)